MRDSVFLSRFSVSAFPPFQLLRYSRKMAIVKTLLTLALALSTAVANGSSIAAPQPYVNYSTVTGYFLQDEAGTDPSTFDYTAVNFGLLNRTYDADSPQFTKTLTQWERFYRQVEYLNKNGKRHGVEYKVLFLGRHGEGWHNAAESYYGTPAWNCYWAELTGNGTASWSDAHLTTKGIAQAQVAHDFWQSRFKLQRMHAPDAYFVSPLTRCLQTINTTFSTLALPHGAAPYEPLVLEHLRESISIHTCDRRSNKTAIQQAWPQYRIEKGFAECDELWNGVTGESDSSQEVRSLEALNQIWKHVDGARRDPWGRKKKDEALFISVTSHSGEIASILEVVGHREFGLNTGAVIPVLVKAQTLKTAPTPTTTQPWQTSLHCTAPPVTSVTAGCVCASSAAPVTTPLVATGGCQ
ncbi:histidine phosphatase superfamily [Talaromyces proteolyticus]|uniref:Histidine phosphatase superfamily n=1 Tax=Talaromyces proteolyticus TaxID=1131652 RepID=A0AAD4KUH6_9EURO|nr:histidine phosphatase superfamily [Talaromyces proteolyticus]KAH8697300.1 histidine phosphatase superfamily [Talaromyces proteolyticus]